LGVNTGRNQDETELSTISVWEILQFKWQQFYGGTDWFISTCLLSVLVSRAVCTAGSVLRRGLRVLCNKWLTLLLWAPSWKRLMQFYLKKLWIVLI